MDSPLKTTRPRVGAVVLAAGRSSRMGSPKALLPLDGQPLIGHLIHTLLATIPASQVVVVTGHESKRIQLALDGVAVTFAHNDRWESGGMLSSIQCGAGALRREWDAFFVALLDQPLVQATTLRAMIDRISEPGAKLVLPAHNGRHGHPILIASPCIDEIRSLPASASLRDFVAQHRHQTDVVEVNDPGVLTDVNTPHDFQLLVNLWRTLACPTECSAARAV